MHCPLDEQIFNSKDQLLKEYYPTRQSQHRISRLVEHYSKNRTNYFSHLLLPFRNSSFCSRESTCSSCFHFNFESLKILPLLEKPEKKEELNYTPYRRKAYRGKNIVRK